MTVMKEFGHEKSETDEKRGLTSSVSYGSASTEILAKFFYD